MKINGGSALQDEILYTCVSHFRRTVLQSPREQRQSILVCFKRERQTDRQTDRERETARWHLTESVSLCTCARLRIKRKVMSATCMDTKV